tara:strand:+ start:324 stop:596 length:273 start_codon:yes stop_codon:yes gene_type:complete
VSFRFSSWAGSLHQGVAIEQASTTTPLAFIEEELQELAKLITELSAETLQAKEEIEISITTDDSSSPSSQSKKKKKKKKPKKKSTKPKIE